MDCLKQAANQASPMKNVELAKRFDSTVYEIFTIYTIMYILNALYLQAENGNKNEKIDQYMIFSLIF